MKEVDVNLTHMEESDVYSKDSTQDPKLRNCSFL